MAFDVTKIGKVDNAFSSLVKQFISYLNTSDTVATIVASGYFNSYTDNLRQYDLIFIRGSDASEIVEVTSATGAATVTVDSILDTLSDELTLPGNLTATGDTNVIGNAAKTSYNKLTGHTKFDNRPTGGSADDYDVQIRMESGKTSGSVWGMDNETHVVADGTASVRAAQGVAVLDTGYTATGATYIGQYAQVRADGTFTGSGFMAAQYALVEASAAITASHVCSQWLDSHQANAVTGSHQLAYWTNNGAATMDEALYLYGGNKITALVSFDTCGGGMVTAAPGESMTVTHKVLVNIDGSPYYLQVGTMA